jgi:hypothetical protein
MSALQFMSSSFQHLSPECAPMEVFPQAFARQLIDADGVRARCKSAIPIAIKHLKTPNLPSLPVVRFAPKTNRYIRHAKIQIRQIGQLLAMGVAALNYHSPPTPDPLRNGTEL